jgi:hypothetical protein
MSELTRSNRITAYWQGEGIAVGVFYKTHTKIKEVHSNDADVLAAGFVFPQGTEENPVTAQDKLAAFKTFLQVNASAFGIKYDPVDRRADEYKFPNKYNEENLSEYSKQMAEKAIGDCLNKIQKNVIDGSLVKAGLLAEGTEIGFAMGDGQIEVKESYANGNIKYANVSYPIIISVGDQNYETSINVDVVSGQLKKPRELADGTPLTQTSVKAVLTDNGILPKLEKPAKVESVDVDGEETPMPTADDGIVGIRRVIK